MAPDAASISIPDKKRERCRFLVESRGLSLTATTFRPQRQPDKRRRARQPE